MFKLVVAGNHKPGHERSRSLVIELESWLREQRARVYVVFLVKKDVRVERRRTRNYLNHEEIERQ
jgi:hypothetical protein